MKFTYQSLIVLQVLVGAWHTRFALAADGASASPPARMYRNPLLDGQMMADPDVLQFEGKYYLYGTTHGRGYDVFVSTNLVDWRNEGTAFEDSLGGVWAPDLYHHDDGKIYLYYTDDEPEPAASRSGKQIGVAVADSPLGPFENLKVLASGCIDAHLFRDDDGSLYLYYVSLDDGFTNFVRRMKDPVTFDGEAVPVLKPTQDWEMRSGRVTEGPFLLKHDGVYYLTYSGSGADSPHYAIGYATSKSPLGPFEKYASNPVVHRTAGLYGPGHHCVVTGPDGKLWMLYHQKASERQGYRRFLALDPVWFDQDGVLRGRATRDLEQPAPTAGN